MKHSFYLGRHSTLAVIFAATLLALSPGAVAADSAQTGFTPGWKNRNDAVWLGPHVWANPMEDWRIVGGRAECIRGGANRNVHALTHQLHSNRGDAEMAVTIGLRAGKKGTAGFEIGIRSELGDYRSSLLRGRGIQAGISTSGELFINRPGGKTAAQKLVIAAPQKGVRLNLKLTPGENNESPYTLRLTATAPGGGEPLATVTTQAPANQLVGNIAIVNNFTTGRRAKPGAAGASAQFWFAGWEASGAKLMHHPQQAWGPVLYAMHSLSRNVLKITAQLPPLGADDPDQVYLMVEDGGNWKQIAAATIDSNARTARFRVEDWDSSRDVRYRVVYRGKSKDGSAQEHDFTGTIRKDPVAKEEIVVAGFTGNTDTGFPNARIAANVAIQNPDVLIFTGDQIYESVGGYGIHRKPVDVAILNYLRKIYLWGWAFRDIMRDRPTLVFPDDHDVYQGNIWGNGGNSVPSIAEHARGGYAMHKDFVNAIQRTQTSHHPDPFDPAPVQQGIGVYYGDMVYGRISFAVIEDRKFKSGPEGNVNTWKGRPDHVRDPKIDPATLDKKGLKLLGERQLKFLDAWTQDWRGADMKMVCSQTIFVNLANYHGAGQQYLVADLDSNGWPQTPRDNALRAIRRGFAFHYAGDQHLPSLVQYGVDDWGDAGYAFCVPSIAAGYPRSWRPDQEGRPVQNRPKTGLPNTGEYKDGLGNLVTVHAIGNPAAKNRRPVLELLHDKSSGHGIVRLNKKNRTIKVECWRLLFDAANPQPEDQFPGFPHTIAMQDNYGRKAAAYLPELNVQGASNPVVSIADGKTGEHVYTLRINGEKFRPKVFSAGQYTVTVTDDSQEKSRKVTLKLDSQAEGKASSVMVRFD